MTRLSEEKILWARMSEEKKVGILLLIKYTDETFTWPPEKMAELRKGFDETAQKIADKGVWVIWYNSVLMGKFDAFVVFEVNDLKDWVWIGEEYMRYWSRYFKYFEVHIGVNPTYFDEATKDMAYWKEFDKRMRELGVKFG